MVLDEGMDHGPVIACRRVALNGDETTDTLREILTPIGADMIGKELIEYLDGKIKPALQDHDKATFCKQIESDEARIDWNKSVAEIDRIIRAMCGVTPAWTTLDGKDLLVHKSSLHAPRSNPMTAAGTIFVLDKKLAVACADDNLILEEIQLAGGKPMSGQAF